MRPLPELAGGDPVLIFDLDGTTIDINSFPHWARFLLRARFDGLGVGGRARVAGRTALALAQRKLGLSDHEALKRALQRAWAEATRHDDGRGLATLTASLHRHVRPNLSELLTLVAAGQADAVLATAAAAEYAHALGDRLGFRHILATEPGRDAAEGSNVGVAKRRRVLEFLQRQGWAARPRLLLTDHRDDLPLIEVCNRTAWFGPEAALAQVRQTLPEADIIYCGADAMVSLARLGSAVPGTLSSVSA